MSLPGIAGNALHWAPLTIKRSAKSAQTLKSARNHGIARLTNPVFAGVQLAVKRHMKELPNHHYDNFTTIILALSGFGP
jgi:hypothetical protein